VVVSQVHPKGPAARAGLAQGDVVLAIDGNEVVDPRGVNFRLAVDRIGDDAQLDVWRAGKQLTVKLTLETPPYDPPPETTTLTGKHALSGATVANMSPGLNEEWGFDLFREGVVVTDVQRGSDAARLRFRTGDVIVRLAGKEIDSVDVLARLVREQGRPWLLEVDRGGRLLQVVIN
jgi:serine protease Do